MHKPVKHFAAKTGIAPIYAFIFIRLANWLFAPHHKKETPTNILCIKRENTCSVHTAHTWIYHLSAYLYTVSVIIIVEIHMFLILVLVSPLGVRLIFLHLEYVPSVSRVKINKQTAREILNFSSELVRTWAKWNVLKKAWVGTYYCYYLSLVSISIQHRWWQQFHFCILFYFFSFSFSSSCHLLIRRQFLRYTQFETKTKEHQQQWDKE